MTIGKGDDAGAHGAGLSLGAGINLERFKLNLAYGKYHATSSSILVNLAYSFSIFRTFEIYCNITII